MTIQCCSCHRIKEENEWVVPAVTLRDPRVSHGYCPACLETAQAELAEYQRLFSSRLSRPAAAMDLLDPAFNF